MIAPRAGSVEPHVRTRTRPMLASPSRDSRGSLDSDSKTWLESLASDGHVREEAIARLHALLLRAARFEVARRQATPSQWDGDDLDDLAVQSADDALVAVLAKLDEFRGHSRFTTWAYKFALLEAAVKLRRRPWQGRELPLEPDRWPQFSDAKGSAHADAEQTELLGAVRQAIDTELTPHQRDILVAVALNGVPIDVLSERLNTTRGALYKTIHDARRKLRQRLEADGYALEPAGPRGASS
jgi:RNA polymerase sigma-70 factor, ECF subfamily